MTITTSLFSPELSYFATYQPLLSSQLLSPLQSTLQVYKIFLVSILPLCTLCTLSLWCVWCLSQSTRRVYNTFLVLDEDSNGWLSKAEFGAISNGSMSPLFIQASHAWRSGFPIRLWMSSNYIRGFYTRPLLGFSILYIRALNRPPSIVRERGWEIVQFRKQALCLFQRATACCLQAPADYLCLCC